MKPKTDSTRRCNMKTRIGLAAMTASVLFTLSGGVVAQTPQTTIVNPFGGPGALRGPRATREQRLLELLAQKKAAQATTQMGAVPDGSGGGPGPGQLHYTSIDPPGSAGTYPQAINTAGAITGYYIDAEGNAHAFLRSALGVVSNIDVPGAGGGAVAWVAWAINDAGAVAGDFCNASFTVCPAFVRDSHGNFEAFDAPGDVNGTEPLGINAAGTVTGTYYDVNFTAHGFVRDSGGAITEFDAPGVGTGVNAFGTEAVAINPAGTISGCYADTNNTFWGFVRAKDGVITTFDVPGPLFSYCAAGFGGQFSYGISPSGATTGSYFFPVSEPYYSGNYRAYIRYPNGTYTGFDAVPNPSSPCCTWTFGVAINEAETVVGSYNDYRNANHGFVRTSDGTVTSLDFPPTAAGPSIQTLPAAINASGWVVGSYWDAAHVVHGFLWKP
jgi:hypothetical protein